MEKKRFKKIYIEITNCCNLKCSFCKASNRVPRVMTSEEFEQVILKIKSYTNLIALHVKGEPLMHPNLKQILEICDKNNIFVNLTTNGTLLYENIEILKNSKSLRQINISLHSMEKYEGAFLKTEKAYLEDIFKGVKILKEVNYPYISYRLWNMKNLSENQENIFILKAVENEYKIDNLSEKAKQHEFIELDEKIFLNQDIEFVWPDLNKKEKREEGTCLGLRNQIAILSNGDIVPCCLDQNADIRLGNVFDSELIDVLESEKSKEIIKGFEEGRLIHQLCKTCGFVAKFEKNYNIR